MTTNTTNNQKQRKGLSMKDFYNFLSAKSFREQIRIITIHSQKNQEKLKKENKIMKNEEKKKIFMKKAFHDMKENAKAQHQVDKANIDAVKAESKANFEENRGTNTLKRAKENAKQNWDEAHLSPSEKTARLREEQQKQIEEANARKLTAEERTAKARAVREEEKK